MESMESHEAGFPPFPHSLEIPSGFPHSHGLDDWIPTPQGERVLQELEIMLPKLDRLISGSTFDPVTEHCSFRIAATDNATSIIAPVLCREVLPVARQVRFTFASWRGDVFE